MSIYEQLPETLSILKEVMEFQPELDELPRCLCGNLIDSDDPDEPFCIECKIEGAEIRCRALEGGG